MQSHKFITVELTVAEFVQRWLSEQGLVAIERDLINQLAECDNPVSKKYRIYRDVQADTYRQRADGLTLEKSYRDEYVKPGGATK